MSRCKPFVLLLSIFIIAYIVQHMMGGYWGLTISFLLLLMGLVLDNLSYQKIKAWVHHPLLPPSHDMGRFEELATPIYKTLRNNEQDISYVKAQNKNILSAANAFPAAVVILDKNFVIRWCNKYAKTLLGIDYKSDIGYNLFNIIRWPEFYKYVHTADWKKAYTRYLKRNDQLYHLRFELTKYSSDNVLLLCFDNTHLEMLRTYQQDFIANVSHELRTPLTVLMGFLETLDNLPDGAITPEQHEHFINLMQEQANRMLAIVTDLLTLSTLESTNLQNEESVPIANLIEQAQRQAEILSKNQHVFTWDVDYRLVVNGNQNELNSAITNLITNAIRYTPEQGTIDIFWGLNEEGNAVFRVKDSGLGISPSDLTRITDRFYRVDKSRSRASGGTGLGLAITKHIAIRHNAKLLIKSKLNKGSTFSLVFPKDALR